MGDRYQISDETKQILYRDANSLYGWAMSQMLPYHGIEMWHGHPDLYMDQLEDTLNFEDDSDIDYFIAVDLKNPDNAKEKIKKFPFAPEKTCVIKMILLSLSKKLNLIIIHEIKN